MSTSSESQTDESRHAAGDCLAFAVRKAARVLTQTYDESLAPVALKSTQFSLLNAANLADGVGINRLAEIMAMDRTTLTRNLRPLVSEGLIDLRPGADRRSRTIRITPAGRRRLARALPLWREAQNRAVERLGVARSDRLRRDLAAVLRLPE